MSAPSRPLPTVPAWQERAGSWLFTAAGPPGPGHPNLPTPATLAPFEELSIPRRDGASLSATFYPATAPPRGAVLLLHPWLPYGRGYFHRRQRVPRLRQSGYHVLTPDLSGFGASGRSRHFFDRELEDAVAFLREKVAPLPVHLWGVSAGGYWSHPVVARDPKIRAAFFEDVAPHLLHWSWRTAPAGRPFYLIFRTFLPEAWRYLDMRLHAAGMRHARTFYVSGAEDRGLRPEETRSLAAAAGGEAWVVPDAEHLGSIQRAGDEVVRLALELFDQAAQPEEVPQG